MAARTLDCSNPDFSRPFLSCLSTNKRGDESSGSESDICSPDGKKVYVSNCDTPFSESDISEASFNETDQVYTALKMSEKIAKQLQQILNRLDSMEKKLQNTEGVPAQISGLEKLLNNSLKQITTANEETEKMEKTINDLEIGLTSTNTDIADLEVRYKQNLKKMENLKDQILHQDVYSRRENFRFFGLSEAAYGAKSTSAVLCKFFEGELNLETPRSIAFQQAHQSGKKKTGQPRELCELHIYHNSRNRRFSPKSLEK